MDYREAVNRIMGLVDYERPSTIPGQQPRYDLNRIGAFLELLGNPHLQTPTVHVAGTKGKGSTSAMVSSILTAAGYNPGMFSSPHMHTFRERIRVSGEPVPEQEFAGLVDELWPTLDKVVADGHGRVTLFELITAMAFHHFRVRGLGAQVIEVGLGGRLDTTNVVQPLVCGITSIGLDHTEVLGDTIELIAGEKAGIIKRGIPVVTSPQKPEALTVIREVAGRHGSALTEVGRDIRWEEGDASLDGQRFSLETPKSAYRLETPLLGRYQLENAGVAVGLVESLIDSGIKITSEHIREGLRRVEWPCRMEVIQRDPLLIVDGAHNPHSAGRIVEAVRDMFPERRVALIVGVSGNKDLPGLVEELSKMESKAVIATRSRHPRAAAPERIAQAFSSYTDRIHQTDDVTRALEMAFDMAGEVDLILTTGSLFVAAEAREVIKGIEPELYPVIEAQPTSTAPNG